MKKSKKYEEKTLTNDSKTRVVSIKLPFEVAAKVTKLAKQTRVAKSLVTEILLNNMTRKYMRG